MGGTGSNGGRDTVIVDRTHHDPRQKSRPDTGEIYIRTSEYNITIKYSINMERKNL